MKGGDDMGAEKGAWKGIVLGLTSSVVFALVVPWGTWATTQIYDLRQRLAEDKIMAEFVKVQLVDLKEEQQRTTKAITELRIALETHMSKSADNFGDNYGTQAKGRPQF
jgi:inhibitor of KinA sporulation pathway (predicted exonuclease)